MMNLRLLNCVAVLIKINSIVMIGVYGRIVGYKIDQLKTKYKPNVVTTGEQKVEYEPNNVNNGQKENKPNYVTNEPKMEYKPTDGQKEEYKPNDVTVAHDVTVGVKVGHKPEIIIICTKGK